MNAQEKRVFKKHMHPVARDIIVRNEINIDISSRI
jgi:hypothetical protein